MPRNVYINSAHSGEWWHVDSRGRRIGYMWPEDFKISIDSMWGERKGIAAFAEYSGLSQKVVEEYCNGKSAVPKYIAQLVMALTRLMPQSSRPTSTQRRVRDFPHPDADWLEKTTNTPDKGLADRPFG